MQKLLNEVLSVAIDAGREIMGVYQCPVNLKVDAKQDGSPLTQADLLAHKLIVAGLSSLAPNIPILSEESKPIELIDRKSWLTYWLIDPLDGTKEFINRNGQFTVNIALIEKGKPVLGVVYAPVLNKAYFGGVGLGAFVQIDGSVSRCIQCSAALPQSLRVVASKSHSDEQTTDFLEKLDQYDLTPMGSSLKLCLVAEGEADVYPRFGPTMEWDTAAAQAIVEAAGGVVCDVDGLALSYNKQDLHNPAFFVMSAILKERILKLLI